MNASLTMVSPAADHVGGLSFSTLLFVPMIYVAMRRAPRRKT